MRAVVVQLGSVGGKHHVRQRDRHIVLTLREQRPFPRVMQVVLGIMHYGGMGFRIYPGAPWARHVMIAMASFSVSGLLRMAEFFVQQGTGGIS